MKNQWAHIKAEETTYQSGRTRKLPVRAFAHVDALRAAAVMMVVVSHAGLEKVPGGSGVTVFFVISGFIITHLLLREYEKTTAFDVRGFYLRRALKIFPPLVVIVVIPSLIYALFRPVDWVEVVGQVFFYFNWTYVDSHVQVLPGSIVVWSLSIEEQFYVAVALIWLLLVRRGDPISGLRVLAWGIVVCSFGARVVLHLTGATSDRIYFGTDTRAEAIAMGILVALWFRNRRLGVMPWRAGHVATIASADTAGSGSAPAPSALVPSGSNTVTSRVAGTPASRVHGQFFGSDVALVGAAAIFLISLVVRDETFRDTVRYSIQAGAGAVVIMWGLVGPTGPLGRIVMAIMKWQVVQLLGLASYSIYLAHLIVIRALEPWLEQLPDTFEFLAGVVAGTSVGVVVWWLVEEPIVRWRQARKSRKV